MTESSAPSYQHIHMVGIGGVGMSGIAEVLLGQGFTVSGSDRAEGRQVTHLRQMGAKIALGHDAANIAGADIVVISSAIAEDNPEVQAAHDERTPVVPRAQMLAELMRNKFGIAVAGTHGKTTTTSMIASCFVQAGLDPTFVIGGQINHTDSHAQLGASDTMIVEADESDGSFLLLSPKIAIITNISADHLSSYGDDVDSLCQAFLNFIHRLPLDGLVVLGIDDLLVAKMLPDVARPVLTFGFEDGADFQASDYHCQGLQSQFKLVRPGQVDLPTTLNLPGEHNVQNALAAMAVASHLQVSDDLLQQACASFSGVGRRFQVAEGVIIGDARINLIDDYGHHPREMVATIKTMRQVWPDRRLVWCFQPHRYSRVSALFEEFVAALSLADLLLLLPIYAAHEAPIAGVDSAHLAAQVASRGAEVLAVDNLGELPADLAERLQDGDVVLCQGAGDIHQTTQALVQGGQDV